jgi:4-hydroxy-tetrahydrodipicolinate synthase
MTRSRVERALRGVSGVHVTPYTAAGDIDTTATAALVGRMAMAGVHNIVSGGNTGEFFALAPGELDAVQVAAIDGNAGRAVLTVAVGRSIPEAVERARFAARHGADAVMVHHPVDPFAAPSAQIDYFRAIADASPLPVVAYLRSAGAPPSSLAALAAHANIVGVKFATQDLMFFAECLRHRQETDVTWVCGLAESWAAPFHALGARGFTSGLVNVAPQRSLAIHAALDAGDYQQARRLVDQIAPFESMRARHGGGSNVTVVKEAMAMLGLPVGPVRSPGLVRLDDRERAELEAILRAWGATLAPTSHP